jgi:hypothetical protein
MMDKVICLVYVDDALLYSPKNEYMLEVIQQLKDCNMDLEVEGEWQVFLEFINRYTTENTVTLTLYLLKGPQQVQSHPLRMSMVSLQTEPSIIAILSVSYNTFKIIPDPTLHMLSSNVQALYTVLKYCMKML